MRYEIVYVNVHELTTITYYNYPETALVHIQATCRELSWFIQINIPILSKTFSCLWMFKPGWRKAENNRGCDPSPNHKERIPVPKKVPETFFSKVSISPAVLLLQDPFLRTFQSPCRAQGSWRPTCSVCCRYRVMLSSSLTPRLTDFGLKRSKKDQTSKKWGLNPEASQNLRWAMAKHFTSGQAPFPGIWSYTMMVLYRYTP